MGEFRIFFETIYNIHVIREFMYKLASINCSNCSNLNDKINEKSVLFHMIRIKVILKI